MIDKVIFSFKGILKNNTEGLFGEFKNSFGKNGKIETYQPEQENEADDMNVEPQVELFTNRLLPSQNYNGRFAIQNYNGRPIRSDFIYKLINDLCAEGRYIPGICNA
ncbi:GSCOCG00011003001-RA-CDS [Cotesia congregata]|nr:GSCOCG00011003001-RA-CDS [Cotesia congregata]